MFHGTYNKAQGLNFSSAINISYVQSLSDFIWPYIVRTIFFFDWLHIYICYTSPPDNQQHIQLSTFHWYGSIHLYQCNVHKIGYSRCREIPCHKLWSYKLYYCILRSILFNTILIILFIYFTIWKNNFLTWFA